MTFQRGKAALCNGRDVVGGLHWRLRGVERQVLPLNWVSRSSKDWHDPSNYGDYAQFDGKDNFARRAVFRLRKHCLDATAQLRCARSPENHYCTVNGVDAKLEEIYLRAGGNQHYVVNYAKDTRVSDRGRSFPVGISESATGCGWICAKTPADACMPIRFVSRAQRMRQECHRRPYCRRHGGRIVPERGFLELRVLNGGLLTVYVPESTSASTRDRFNRVRVGEQIRLEGERLSEDRLELLAFR